MSVVSAIIFDLDGVLVNTIDMHYNAWRKVAQSGGRDLTPTEMETLRGIRRSECLQILFPEMTLTPQKIENFLQIKHTSFIEALNQAKPDDILINNALQLIESAQDAGLKLGIASSSINAQRVIKQIGLTHKFEVIANGSSVSRSKPNPDIFLWAAGALGVYPQHALVFEDSVAGINAAKQAGMKTVGVANPDTKVHADTYYDTLSKIDLQTLLNDLNLTVDQSKHIIGDHHARNQRCARCVSERHRSH